MVTKSKSNRYKPITIDELPEMMTCSQAGQYLQVCDNTVAKWIRDGILPACRFQGSRVYRIPKSVLINFITNQGSPV